jgi:hypothetical protein
MLTKIGSIVTISALVLVSTMAFGNCNKFQKDADAFEGLVFNKNKDGSIRSYSMYGEATFLFPKRSLISDARRKAELSARRSFAEFLSSGFDADTVATDLIETEQITDLNGNTSGLAREITSTLNTMRQNSSATLAGIVKLDECVDTDEKFILVKMGWKPETSKAAANARNIINDDISNSSNGQSSGSNSSGDKARVSSKLEPVEGYRKKSSLADDF